MFAFDIGCDVVEQGQRPAIPSTKTTVVGYTARGHEVHIVCMSVRIFYNKE